MVKFRLIDCPACMDYFHSQPHLVGACASVGIERGKSTQEMLVSYLSDYHRNGHKERNRTDEQPA